MSEKSAMKNLIVLDTNILVNALKSREDGAKSRQLLRDVIAGRYVLCVSSYILSEYDDVLHRKKLNISKRSADWLLGWIRTHAFFIEPLASTSEEVEMKDEKDRPFFDVAKCLDARLVTRNYKDFPVHELVTLIDELY